MSVSFAGKMEMVVRPYGDLDELVKELKRVPRKGVLAQEYWTAVKTAIAALELLRDFLAGEAW